MMGTRPVDPKVWVLEQLLSEEDSSIELIQACRVPDAVLNDAAPWLKQRFALRLLADALEGGQVPSAALQLVSILAVPELGWEGDVAALIVAVKLQACVDILKDEGGASRKDWKGFSTCVAQLFENGSDEVQASKDAHKDLVDIVKPSAKKQREAALEKLLNKHPTEQVLEELRRLLQTAAKHMPPRTIIEQLASDVEAKRYTPNAGPSTSKAGEVLSVGNGLRSSDGGAAADGLNHGHVSLPQGGTDDLLPAEAMQPNDKEDGPMGAQTLEGPSQQAAAAPAAKLGPRRKVTEKRPLETSSQPENAGDMMQLSPEQGPPKKGRKGAGKRKRPMLSDDEETGGDELALAETGVKRGPGRPRVHPKPDPDAPKRPRGRPRVYENGAPPRSPMRRRKSGGAGAGLASPDQGVKAIEGGGPSGAVSGKGGLEQEEEEDESTPLKRRRVVAEKRGGGSTAGGRNGQQGSDADIPPVDDAPDGAPPPDSQMDDPLDPPDHTPPRIRSQALAKIPQGTNAKPPATEGLRRKGLKMLEEMEKANQGGGENVDFEMPELGPEEEGGDKGGAQFLTLTEDGSNDWCCLCDVKLGDVDALLLCTGCPNATCYVCAGVSETPPLEYICPLCLAKLKRKRDKEIRAKLEVTRKRTQEPLPAAHPVQNPLQPLPVSRPTEHLEPGPSTQRARLPIPHESGPEEKSERPGDIPEQGQPGQEKLPELPEEAPELPEAGGGEGGNEGEGKEKAKVEEKARTEEGRRNNRYWSPAEVEMLKEAVVANVTVDNTHRVPWETIRAYGVRRGFFQGRRGVDLKDKWRNLKRAEEKAARS